MTYTEVSCLTLAALIDMSRQSEMCPEHLLIVRDRLLSRLPTATADEIGDLDFLQTEHLKWLCVDQDRQLEVAQAQAKEILAAAGAA